MLHHQDSAIGGRRRNGVAVDALGFFCEPLDEGGAVGDLAPALGERLALFPGHEDSEIFLVRHHQVEPATKDRRPLLGGGFPPALERGVGGVDGALGLGCPHIGDRAQHVTIRGVGHLDGLAAISIDPLAVDVALLLQERRVFQMNSNVFKGCRHHLYLHVTPNPPWAAAFSCVLHMGYHVGRTNRNYRPIPVT